MNGGHRELTDDEPQGDTGSARILVAEDNVVNRKLAVALVRNWGFTPLVAGNGEERSIRGVGQGSDGVDTKV